MKGPYKWVKLQAEGRFVLLLNGWGLSIGSGHAVGLNDDVNPKSVDVSYRARVF